MAKSKNNMVMKGTSGKVGDMIVFRQQAGQTIIATAPKIDPNREATDVQKTHRERFANAATYAMGVMGNEALKTRYAALANRGRGQSAYNMAFADYMYEPELRSVNAQNYQGQVGNVLAFMVRDVLEVTTVAVSIIDGNGNPVESGAAQPDEAHVNWTYTATVQNEALTGTTLEVSLTDTPGKTVIQTVELG